MANEVRLNHLIIKSTFIVVFIVFWLTLPAQNHNDTLHLETVEIVDQRLEQVLGYHETKLTKRLVTDRVSVNLADFFERKYINIYQELRQWRAGNNIFQRRICFAHRGTMEWD